METLFAQESALCDYQIDIACRQFSKIPPMLFEEREQVSYLTEKTGRTLLESIQAFFQKIIISLKQFGKSVTQKYEAKMRTKEMNQKLRLFHSELENRKRQGKKTITMIDVWFVDKTIESSYKKIRKISKKILNTNYRYLTKLDEDYAFFTKTYDQAEKDFNDALESEVTVPIEKALQFVEDQVTGHDTTTKGIDTMIAEMEDMQLEVETLIKKREVDGLDALPEKLSIVRKITSKISGWFHNVIGKRLAKIFACVVFILA